MSDLGSTRVIGQHGAGGGIVAIGLKRRPLKDLYHWLVTGSWARVMAVFALAWFTTAALFGVARLLLAARLAPGGLAALVDAAAAPPPAPGPALSARAVALGALGAVDDFVHWLELVLGAGVVLAKFSLVRARVLFSNVAVIAAHDGGRALVFRMANERTSHIVDAKVSVMLVRNELVDREPVRRAFDLDLVRGESALFSHAWTAIHRIGRGSPLLGESAASLAESGAEIIVNLSGFDEGLVRTVHARHVYRASRIKWDVRFREIVTRLPDGRHAVDYRKFHKTAPVEAIAADGTAPAEKVAARRAR